MKLLLQYEDRFRTLIYTFLFRSILSSISGSDGWSGASQAAGDGLRAGRGGQTRTKAPCKTLHDPLRTQVRDGREGYSLRCPALPQSATRPLHTCLRTLKLQATRQKAPLTSIAL